MVNDPQPLSAADRSVEHVCESYASPSDADCCLGEPTHWSERFRAWLCAEHTRIYTERADYVQRQRAAGAPVRVTWREP
jgi:hypothetical protein